MSKQNCLYASILCGTELFFKQPDHKLWFTIELDNCQRHLQGQQGPQNQPQNLQNHNQITPNQDRYKSKFVECRGYSVWPQWDETIHHIPNHILFFIPYKAYPNSNHSKFVSF